MQGLTFMRFGMYDPNYSATKLSDHGSLALQQNQIMGLNSEYNQT